MNFYRVFLLIVTTCLVGLPVRGVVAPYTVDSSTLHLWHFDETSPPCVDSASGGTNLTYIAGGATQSIASYSNGSVSFTNCVSFGTLTTSNAVIFPIGSAYVGTPIPFTYAGATGAFTYEATVQIQFNPTNNYSLTPDRNEPCQIMNCDADNSGTRVFQFRLDPVGFAAGGRNTNVCGIEFINGTTTVAVAPIPTNGPDAIATNEWYHVAVTYNGNPGTTSNLLFYWTLLDPSRTNADCIYGTNMTSDLPGTSASTTVFSVGNSARNPSGGTGPASANFLGNLDEVRISSVARAANQMLFTSGASSSLSVSATVIAPVNPVYAGTLVTLSSTVSGTQPISYVWQSDGGTGGVTWTNLPNSTTNAYSLNTSTLPPGNYQYQLVVSNAGGSATNTPATLDLLAASGPVLVTNTAIDPSIAPFVGSSVELSASFSGTQPIYYQWYFITNGGGTNLIVGATSSTFTIASIQTNNAGSYFLMASNNPPGLGSQTALSSPAALTIAASYYKSSTGMFCDLLEHPEETVITASTPKFGWFYQPSFRNDYQTGYRVIVASSQTLANAGTGNLWDSGVVNSSNSINVAYGGAALQPNTSYYWAVQTVNSLGRTNAFSAVQQFNTAGLLSNPLTTGGVIYQQPGAGSANCYPLRYVPISPVLVTNTSSGVWFIDFGRDGFGYATENINGNYSGATVSFGLGEAASGYSVNTSPAATIRYWSGSYSLQNGNFVYTNRSTTAVGTISPPSATYGIVSPFRYLQLTGVPAGVTLTSNNVTQWRLETEFDPTAATFNSSSAALNQVWNLCHYSMEALTFDGIYVDGDRERTPYEADTSIHQMSSYGAANEFTLPRCTFEYLTNHLTWPTEWPMHMIFVAWADYQQTGDPYLMTKYYGFLTNKCMLYGNARANGLVWSYPETGNTASGDIIDWYRISGDGVGNVDGYVAEGTNAVINAFYYRCLTIMTNIAQLTGHTADAATFAARAALVYNNYNNVFWNSSSQSYIDGVGTTHSSADANFFPLAFGLVPTNNQAAVINYIHSRIAALGAMPAGVYGAQYLLNGMFQAGDADTALGLLTTNNTRSWMNMINIGSTLTDEAWSTADKSNEDWNHAWGSAPGSLIPRYVLGLCPLAPGCGQILIQPHLGTTLSFVQGTIPTIRGPVSILASNVPGQFQLLLNIPGNVTATVMLPATNAAAILDGAVISGTLSTDSLSNSWLTITNIGSGQHALWASSTNTPTTTTLYNNWASSWFGTNAANAAIAGQTANPDGNGFDNYYDFVTGTDPTNPNAHFTFNLSVPYPSSPDGLLMTVAGLTGRNYILQRSLNLSPPVWIGIVTSNLTSNQTLQFSDPQPPTNQAFYRVAVTMP